MASCLQRPTSSLDDEGLIERLATAHVNVRAVTAHRAAQRLTDMHAALSSIAAGIGNPMDIARRALKGQHQ